MAKKQFITTICIDNDNSPFDDKQWLEVRHFKPTNLLRKKIKEMREEEEGADTIESLRTNVGNLQNQIQKIIGFLENKKLLDEFLKQ